MNKLKELIKKIVAEIKSEQKLKETTGTGVVGAITTPFAFSKNKNGNVKAATQLGMKLVGNIDEKKSEKTTQPVEPKKEVPLNRKDLNFITKNKKRAIAKKNTAEVDHLDRIETATKQKLRIREITDPVVKTPLEQFNNSYSKDTTDLIKKLIQDLNSPSTGIIGKTINIDARKNNPNTPTTFPYSNIKITSVGFEKVKNKLFLVLVETSNTKSDKYYIEIGTSLTNGIPPVQSIAKSPAAPQPVPAQNAAPAVQNAKQTVDPKLNAELNK